MRSNRLLLGFGLFLAFLMAAEQAHAGAWCTTRNKCHWWAKKFTANAQVGCIGFSLPLCYKHSGSCDWTANLSCGWRNCIWGGGDASADNGWNGCHTWTTRSGQGVAGNAAATTTRDDDQGGHDVLSHAEFDDATRTVTITLDRGDITSLKGGMAARFDVYVVREDVTEGDVPKGQEEVDDPVPTPENTLWHGAIVLRDGQVSADGFDSRAIKVTTDEKGLTHATFENLKAVQSFDIPDADFANLVVQVAAEEE